MFLFFILYIYIYNYILLLYIFFNESVDVVSQDLKLESFLQPLYILQK